MMRTLIDTNAILRFLLNDVQEQANKVEEIIAQAKQGKLIIIIPQIVIFEIYFALEKYYHLSKTQIIEKIESIIASKEFEIQDRESFSLALALFKAKNIDFADCFLISYAKSQEASIFTFDRKMGKQAT